MVGQTITNPAFERATEEAKKLKELPSNEDQLKLYGLFKIGHGIDIKTAKQPGLFDPKGRYKYTAWKEMVEEGKTPAQAQQEYITFLNNELKPKYGFNG